jgi:hypothetical protein
MGTGMAMGVLDMLKILPKAIRGLTPREYEELFTKFSEKAPNTPLMPFLYVHGGYREMWSRPDLADPALPRGLPDYMRQSIDRGWTKIHPPEDRKPRALIFTGSNPLRRWPAPQHALEHLWPKLDLIVAANFRMSTSALHADYVLPAAGYYEKHGIKYAQSYLPYIIVSDQAVKPLGESKTEWEIFGVLTERIALRAAERGVTEVRGFQDEPLDLTQAYACFTADGRFDPHDPADPARESEHRRDRGRGGAAPRSRAGAGHGTAHADLRHLQRLRSERYVLAASLVRGREGRVADAHGAPTVLSRSRVVSGGGRESTGAQGSARRAQPFSAADQRRSHALEHPRHLAGPRPHVATATRRARVLPERCRLRAARHSRWRPGARVQRRGLVRGGGEAHSGCAAG